MFGITYDTWKNVCNMYFSLSTGSQKAYLQWFPFTKLTRKDKETIASESFYNRYILTSSFLLFPHTAHQSENFLQKGDGSFRDSALVSPFLYLVLQAVGKEIHDKYVSVRPEGVSVYYAGNYKRMRAKYKQDYDNFFKELNSCIDEYQYFIKTDISNFFSNINIDKLIAAIDKNCNANDTVFSQTQLHLFKQLLAYCGNGRFPLIENSMASSYLATVVYLDAIDTLLYRYIDEKVATFSGFRIVRYVDDMYIMISSDKPVWYLHEAYNEIINEYSSILIEYGLALNSKKCCLKETTEINGELKKSLYDEFFNGEKHNIEDHFSGALKNFLNALSNEMLLDCIDNEKYNELISKHFSSDDIEFTPSEVFNYYVYENEEELRSEPVIAEIIGLVERNISFTSLDPKRLTVMIMKTQNDRAIKGFLNQLFKRNRAGKWNSYDTTIAITYLIQSQFRHIDLLDILSAQHPDLYSFYYYNCRSSFLNCLNSGRLNELGDALSQDKKAHYLYFMYLCELKHGSNMAAFAYFKNYFDRVTADLEYVYDRQPNDKRPNYNKFYKETEHKNFYSDIENSEIVIKTAHKYRNSNPLSHASSELLDNDSTSENLKESIQELTKLIMGYIDSKQPILSE